MPTMNPRVKRQSQRARVLRGQRSALIENAIKDIITASSAKTAYVPATTKFALEHTISKELIDLNYKLGAAAAANGALHTDIAWVLLGDTMANLQEMLISMGAPIKIWRSGQSLLADVQKVLSLRPQRVDIALQTIADWTFHQADEAKRPARSQELAKLIAELLRKQGLYAYREPLDRVVDEFQAYLYKERPELLAGEGVLGNEVFVLEPQITERYLHLLEEKGVPLRTK